MFKTFGITVLTVATLALGGLAASTPAEAGVGIGFGFGFGSPFYGNPYYGDPYYGGPRYGHWRHHRVMRCGWVAVRRHHHFVNVRRCQPVYY